MSDSAYPYSQGDRLNERNSYFYSEFRGPAFFDAWRAARFAALSALPSAVPPEPPAKRPPPAAGYDTAQILAELLGGTLTHPQHDRLAAHLLQRFEVSKRLHRRYDPSFRAVRDSGYDDLELYVQLATLCLSHAQSRSALPFLNGLLKIVDTLVSVRDRLDPNQRARLAWLIGAERDWVARVAAGLGRTPRQRRSTPRSAHVETEQPRARVEPAPQSLADVLLIAAPSARSQAYVQTLCAHGLCPSHALLLGDPPDATPRRAALTQHLHGVLLPDLDIPVAHSLATAGVASTRLQTRDVNAAEVADAVRARAPRLIVYSGFGGQIVQPQLIALGIPLLHVHSGWLPDYRGSTTLYYSLLEEGSCAASAILLDPQIDTGPILARKRYPAPPLGTDIDRRYDPAIRADLLCDVLRRYRAGGGLQGLQRQAPEAGRTYYVIHPVLKHLALLNLPAAAVPPPA